MISKKIHHSNVIDFYNPELNIHNTIKIFSEIGIEYILYNTNELDEFDKYIITYFFDGIRKNNEA